MRLKEEVHDLLKKCMRVRLSGIFLCCALCRVDSVSGCSGLVIFCLCYGYSLAVRVEGTCSDLVRRKSVLQKRREISYHGETASTNDFVVICINDKNCRKLCNAVLSACFGMPVSVNLNTYKAVSESYDRWGAKWLVRKSY